jgi:hypothetical protein
MHLQVERARVRARKNPITGSIVVAEARTSQQRRSERLHSRTDIVRYGSAHTRREKL